VAAQRSGERYTRVDTLACYWRGDACLARNYLTRIETPLTPALLAVLECLSAWTSAAELARRHPDLGAARDVTRLLEWLAERRLVRRESQAKDRPVLDTWAAWHPEAALFHFGTKNGRYRANPFSYDAELARKARVVPTPVPTKTTAGTAVALPRGRPLGGLGRALAARRTWRRFGDAPMSLTHLATLLQWTFGVQARGTVPGQGGLVFKTSPSGGSRHPIEAYVATLGVRGLTRGALYHYDAARHALVRLPARLAHARIPEWLGHQPYFAGAAALIVMAPVFERTMWRYPSSRAYRAVLIEAGHLCQTFCLVAAALNLAPFSTFAFRERTWERALGLNGVTETPIYIAGVGTKPADGRAPGAIAPHLARRVARP